ncbi:hypothetical protein OU798_04945 [Prolixibacteraceae bacterium Z1-6]|uniref:Transporter n=1 Tax=Draconibacterium aestuarii TaxID=2998507 RepID=A0A9X3F336_9BACT|nr:hypothetical protein [Prolixibacteraceae bacterium Z1-6]
MRNLFFFLCFLMIALTGNAQKDWSWWNNLHGWEPGDPGWRNWLVISPGYLGPNALPVPEVKRGFLTNKTEFEITASSHFHSGDPTQDISSRAYVPFANGKIAVEVYGVIFEHYAYTTEIRNERFSRDENGKGVAIGDLYFTTLIQLIKDKNLPNTLFRFGARTASGGNYRGARYADTPGYFFDLSFSKDIGQKENLVFRPYTMLGFYSWQTNDELNLQNDALLYGVGTDFEKNNWRFVSSWAGYYGYKNNGDRPMQLNFELRKDYNKKAFRIQYQHGLHDWMYRTVRFSFLWKFKPVN